MMQDPSLLLSVEPVNGSEIGQACRDAQRIADILGLAVRFVFNGVACRARPGQDAKLLELAYWKRSKSP